MTKHVHLHELPIEQGYKYPEPVWAAVNFAASAHETQIRKLSGDHYIQHPFGVLEIVRGVTDDIDIQQAAVLHDTVEDTWVTADELARVFGQHVADLVWGVTKDDSIPGWHTCNEAYLERLEHEAEDGSVIVALGDKIHNITDMIESYERYGDAMWEKFAAKPNDQLWWYSSVLEIAKQRLESNPLIDQLEGLILVFRVKVVGIYAHRAAQLGA